MIELEIVEQGTSVKGEIEGTESTMLVWVSQILSWNQFMFAIDSWN